MLTVSCVLLVSVLFLLTVSSESSFFAFVPLILLTVSCVLLVSVLFLLTVSSESSSGASGSALPGSRKRYLGFPRPEIVFAELFYKGFYKAFCTRPFSRNLAFPAEVSPDGSRSLILMTVSSESSSFASGIAHFADSLVRFATPGAAFADSLVRIVRFRFKSCLRGPPKRSPGLPSFEIVEV